MRTPTKISRGRAEGTKVWEGGGREGLGNTIPLIPGGGGLQNRSQRKQLPSVSSTPILSRLSKQSSGIDRRYIEVLLSQESLSLVDEGVITYSTKLLQSCLRVHSLASLA